MFETFVVPSGHETLVIPTMIVAETTRIPVQPSRTEVLLHDSYPPWLRVEQTRIQETLLECLYFRIGLLLQRWGKERIAADMDSMLN